MGNSSHVVLKCGKRTLDLSAPQVMGILNVTPDSFSDGGLFLSVDNALDAAAKMALEGAAIIDVGGESTRPGAQQVTVQEELDRVLPVVERISSSLDVIVSVDTSLPLLMQEAAVVGAGLINDVRALTREGAVDAARSSGLPVCLMHMQGSPATMQGRPKYGDVVSEVSAFLAGRLAVCVGAGISREQLMVDPGFGFGKSFEHNLHLLRNFHRFTELGCPVLAGVSRKAMIGEIVGKPVGERVFGSVAAAVMAVERGGRVVRVHDVGATVDALKVCRAVLGVKV